MKKKAAFELSIATIVVIVLTLSLFILGMVLVKNVFKDKEENNSLIMQIESIKCEIQNYIEFECDDGQMGFINQQTYNFILNQTNCTQLNYSTICSAS